MAEASRRRIWIGRGIYVCLCAVIMFLHLLPMDTMPRSWGSPDFVLLITLAWAARRPDHVPALLIAAVFLMSDMLFHRPPGLWTALVLLLTEVLRARSRSLRVVPFPLEWLGIAAGIVAITLAYRVALSLTVVPQAPFGLTVTQMMLTILAYPLVALLSFLLFGVSRPAQGEVDSLGNRL
ncbi:rod shape-determining protein MreD [Salibaculum halophilum]|jgi:rod shape-determining protein MreD|uniref:rod shape-determining protein MreD n=1 Tax=Salibaculum halophilum TaxID=1914408 RepID=UPI000A111C53|nr:rod shape-determining protein MreD [Salibaculum halophilum]